MYVILDPQNILKFYVYIALDNIYQNIKLKMGVTVFVFPIQAVKTTSMICQKYKRYIREIIEIARYFYFIMIL